MNATFDAYRETYEEVVDQSIEFSGLPHSFFLEAKAELLAPLFRDRFGPETPPEVLDIGCGVGRLHPLLQPLVGRLAGADISPESLKRAKHENSAVEYRLIENGALPWPAQCFDATLAVSVVHHVAPRERTLFVSEMRRVTKRGGLVILIEHNPWNPLTRLAVLRCPFDADAVLLRAREARQLLRSCGVTGVHSRYFLVFPPQISAPRLERALSRVPLGAQYAAFGEA